MFNLVLILGFLSTACGVFVLGFAFPIRETAFGSALIVAGAVAVVGGLVSFGLAAAVGELRRMTAALKARAPAVPRPLRPVDRKDGSERRPAPPRMPFPERAGIDAPPDSLLPPKPALEAPPARVPPVQKIQSPLLAGAGPERERPVPIAPPPQVARDLERLGGFRDAPHIPPSGPQSGAPSGLPDISPSVASAMPSHIPPGPSLGLPQSGVGGASSNGRSDFPDAVAMSPPAYPAARPAPAPRPFAAPLPPEFSRQDEDEEEAAPRNGPPPTSPEWLRRAFAEIAAAQPNSPGGPPDRYRARPVNEDWTPPTTYPPRFPGSSEAPPTDRYDRGPSGREGNMFDAAWSSGRRGPGERPILDREEDEDRRDPPQFQRPTDANGRYPDQPPPSMAAPPPPLLAFPGPPPSAAPPPQPRPQSILKSGVIDEMAYTLFTDGSIEAQMPEGTMRFASIEDLRRHLDQQAG